MSSILKPVDFDSLNIPAHQPDDVRTGHDVRQRPEKTRISIAGFCSDIGVARNNGRPGAAEAPDLIRTAFYKMTPDPATVEPFRALMQSARDDGNLFPQKSDLCGAQKQLGEYVSEQLEQDVIPVILGGGHETSYGHFLGYAARKEPVTIINWDAHADIRELKDGLGHSGSPFRQAIEHESGMCRRYFVAGLKRHSLSADHLAYLQKRIPKGKAGYFFKGELNKRIIENIYGRSTGSVMVTMDMDALSQSVAPGVSAPNPDGISLPLWLYAAWCAGASPNVRSFDLVEMNPKFDIDGHTARIAALTLWHFFKGMVVRGKRKAEKD